MKLRNIVLRIICLILPLLVFGSVLPVRSDDLRSIVVLREDDIRTTWRNVYPEFGGVSAFNYCMNNHIPITWAAITTCADKSSGTAGLTWAELRQYVANAGGEVGSHSMNHAEMSSQAAYINEVTGSKAAIEAGMGNGYVCKTFLQPGGWTGDAYMDTIDKLNNPIGQAIQSTFQNSMAYLGSLWRTGNCYYRYGLSNVFNIDYDSSLTVDRVNRILDMAANCPGTVLVVSCHGVQATNGTTGYEVPANIMKAFVEKVVALRDAGSIRLMSLADANDTVFPSTINQLPDVAACNPTDDSNNIGPWGVKKGAHMLSGGGMQGGKCLDLTGNNSYGRCGICVPPGRYLCTWWQRVEDGYVSTSAVRVGAQVTLGSTSAPYIYLQGFPWFYNTSPSTWEQKKSLFRVKDQDLSLLVQFQANTSNGVSAGCRVDGMSLVLSPVDPNASPSNFQVAPSPTGGTLSWTTPNDPSITAIEVRYSTASNPIDGSSTAGTLLFNVRPDIGHGQTVPFTMNWSSKPSVYFSVFAKRGTVYSDPDIDYVIASTTPPSVAITQATGIWNGHSTVSWTVQSATAPVYATQYAVGHSAGGSDVIPWTTTSGTSAVLTVPETSGLYVSVKAENQYGYWSSAVSKSLALAVWPIATLKELADSIDTYTITGTVTAVFDNFYYVASPDRISAIRVNGAAGAIDEGQTVTVTGHLSTIWGERVLQISP